MASDPISIWILQLDDTPPDRIGALHRYGMLLDEAEWHHAMSYANASAGLQHIHGRALLRVMLRERLLAWTGCGVGVPSAYRLIRSSRGKPALMSREGHGSAEFSLSHSGRFVACAMSLRREVGFDIESAEREADYVHIAARHFSAREFEDLMARPEAQRRERFLHYWTLKEAYLKACGAGLADRLERVGFISDAGDRRITLCDKDDALADDKWGFSSFSRIPGCIAALCWRRKSSCLTPAIDIRVMDEHEFAQLAQAGNSALALHAGSAKAGLSLSRPTVF